MNYGLTNRYIETVLEPYCKIFKGVFSCDTIPVFGKNSRFSVIVNLSRENQPGSHFISIYVNKTKAYYFDSLGLPCINRDISKYLKQYSVTSNVNQFQCLDSFFCGYYCMLFVILIERGMSFTKFKKLFSADCKNNDTIVVELLKYIFRISR